MIRHACLCGLLLMTAAPAHAALALCNRTSYVRDAAIGLESRGDIATRGWFRVVPGQCRQIHDGSVDSDTVYIHGRVSDVYGAPTPRPGHAELCVGVGDKTFEIANARSCPVNRQVSFIAARPSDVNGTPTVNLAEESDYDNEQARLAGIQRLLVIAGYDASPIDGIDGARTQAALARFLKDRKLAAEAPAAADFFDTLMTAARNPEGFGFSWCNDTNFPVMAALGIAETGSIVKRGWYRVPASECVRPALHGDPRRVYSYAEAVDADGRAIQRGAEALSWGGTVTLCTRDGKFELADHKDCSARGLNSTGFVAIDIRGQPATTIRFKEP